MAQAAKIRWLRIVGAGLAGELVLAAITAAIFLSLDPEAILPVAILPATLVTFALFGFWAARPVAGAHVLHGVLAGTVGVVLYGALAISALFVPGAPELDFATMLSPLSLLAHALKLVGGGLGGYLAARRTPSLT